MLLTNSTAEPYVIGAGFYRTLEERATRLEADADRDERFAAALVDSDHRRRHRQLVQMQREHAAILREFLIDAKIRPAA